MTEAAAASPQAPAGSRDGQPIARRWDNRDQPEALQAGSPRQRYGSVQVNIGRGPEVGQAKL